MRSVGTSDRSMVGRSGEWDQPRRARASTMSLRDPASIAAAAMDTINGSAAAMIATAF